MKKNKFKLSPAGKLTVILSFIISPVAISHASNIVASESNIPAYTYFDGKDHDLKTGVQIMPSGATEIKIVAPSEHGISHNVYTDFNVNEYGVIFNNATENFIKDGMSYDANQKLNGSAARVILNEVHGGNPSILAGKQSIIGVSADYILANANGISCQGCSFSPEFKNVTLAVGGVNIENGGNVNINTAGNAEELKISGGKENNYIHDNALTLISPVINSNGHVNSREALNLVVGQNKVYLDSQNEHRVEKINSSVKTIDGYYLGGMSGYRIKIIDTRSDNNLNLFSGAFSIGEIDIKTEGTLRVREVNNEVSMNGMNKVYLQGKKVDISRSLTDEDKKVVGKDANTTSTIIQGGIVHIEADDNINISGVSIDSKDKTFVKANVVTVDAHLDELKLIGHNWSKKAPTPIGHKKTVAKGTKLVATRTNMSSSGETYIEGEEKLSLKGADISADKSINLTSNSNIELSGNRERETKIKDIKYFHYGTDLRTGHDNSTKIHETFSPLIMKSSGDIKIISGKDVNIHGANITAQGKLSIKGEKNIKVSVADMVTSDVTKMDYKQALGIAGSEKDNQDKYLYSAYKSQLTGKDININSTGNVLIFASKITSLGDTAITAKNGLRIYGILDKSTHERDKETGGAFDITLNTNEKNNKNEGFIDSELTSAGNLRLFSERDIYIDGARINTEGHLDIAAQKKVTIQAARQQQRIDEKSTRLNMEWFAKESSDKQFRAGFLIKHKSDNEKSTASEHQTATLGGKSVNITGKNGVEFFGTAINTTDGDLTVKSNKNVGFFTAKNRSVTDKNSVETSGGLYVTGGMDKFGSGLQVSHTDKGSHSNIESNLVVNTNVNGNLTISAGGDLTQQGTQHTVAKNYLVDATNINNMASNNLAIAKTNTLQIDGSLGQNVDYRGMTRPIEKAIKDPANTLDYIGGRGSQKGVSDPTLGVDLDISGSRTKTSANDALALVTTINAQDIKQVAKKDVLDEGTQYQATEGKMSLQAERHFSRAAVNSKENTSEQEKGAGSLRVGITATKDIKGHLGGKGETSRGDSYAEEMLVGNINAKSGVSIKTTGDAYYYATNIDGGSGDVTIDAGNHLYFDQVQDSQRSNNVKYEGNGKLSAGGSSGSKNFRLEGGGGYQQARAQRANAIVSKINTQGNVSLNAGADLTAKGVLIGSKEVPTNNVSLQATRQVKFLAAVSGSADMSDGALADFRLGGKRATGGASKEGFVGGGGKFDKVNQSISDREGGHIYANNKVNIKSGSDSNQAIYLQGLQIKGKAVSWDAQNGGVFIESALSELPKDNWEFGANLDMVLKGESPKKADGTIDSDKASQSHYRGAGIKAMVDKQDVFKHQNTHVNSSYFSLNTKKDAVMKGARIDTDVADVNVDGDLIIESVKSREDSVKVDVEFALSHTNDKGSSVTSKLSKLGTKKFEKDIQENLNTNISQVGALYNDKLRPTSSSETKSRILGDKVGRYLGRAVKDGVTNPEGLMGRAKADIQLVNNDAVAEQSGIFGHSEMNVTVKGTSKLHGAAINSTSGQLTLKTEKRELSNIENSYRTGGGGFNISPTALGMLTAVGKDASEGKTPFINNPHRKASTSVSVGEIKGEKVTGIADDEFFINLKSN